MPSGNAGGVAFELPHSQVATEEGILVATDTLLRMPGAPPNNPTLPDGAVYPDLSPSDAEQLLGSVLHQAKFNDQSQARSVWQRLLGDGLHKFLESFECKRKVIHRELTWVVERNQVSMYEQGTGCIVSLAEHKLPNLNATATVRLLRKAADCEYRPLAVLAAYRFFLYHFLGGQPKPSSLVSTPALAAPTRAPTDGIQQIMRMAERTIAHDNAWQRQSARRLVAGARRVHPLRRDGRSRAVFALRVMPWKCFTAWSDYDAYYQLHNSLTAQDPVRFGDALSHAARHNIALRSVLESFVAPSGSINDIDQHDPLGSFWIRAQAPGNFLQSPLALCGTFVSVASRILHEKRSADADLGLELPPQLYDICSSSFFLEVNAFANTGALRKLWVLKLLQGYIVVSGHESPVNSRLWHFKCNWKDLQLVRQL
ncbi:hypothetical protein OIV83_005076 [Microbotryomycetes sp. JL201]|nr:hypothetical protein OIV83_005076 [Microbotryomycetes sp. JL201]